MNKKYTKLCKLCDLTDFEYLFCNFKVDCSAERLVMTFHFSVVDKLLIFKQIQFFEV